VIVLAIDTCDSRGSVAVLREDKVLSVAAHETTEDYSSWLLPAVEGLLKSAGLRMADICGYAAAAGPGSFTGLRVGLTTVKGWAEVYRKPIAAVSRLEAMGVQSTGGAPFVAAFADARRGQVFGAVYRKSVVADLKVGKGSRLTRVGEEMVIAPGKFVETAAELASGEKISWVSTDPAHAISEAAWKDREKKGEKIEQVSTTLAPVIGLVGARLLQEGKATDALGLDANYVRRSDAEIFWKGGSAAHGR
jgi:tRNA threonylcarbamoyladenosine biosynthesis protein TsaB